MTDIQRQIAELNLKRKAEHDQVDKNYDQLIELVRARCVHEPEWKYVISGTIMNTTLEGWRKTGRCKHCGEVL